MPDNAANNGNSRVTNAILATKVDSLTYEVRELKDTVLKCLDDHEGRLRTNENHIARQDEKLKQNTVWLSLYSTLASAVSGLIGRFG